MSNKTVFNDTEKANALANVFEKAHYLTHYPSDVKTETQVTAEYNSVSQRTVDKNSIMLITPKEIINAVKHTKPKKAPGNDGIQNVILKHITKKGIVQLVNIFNVCLALSYFPTCWKNAEILGFHNAFHKTRKPKQSPNSYQPISLLNTLCKLAEIVINERISIFL